MNPFLRLMNDRDPTSPMSGAITNLDMWDRELSQNDIIDWSTCNSSSFGNIVSWETAVLGNFSSILDSFID